MFRCGHSSRFPRDERQARGGAVCAGRWCPECVRVQYAEPRHLVNQRGVQTSDLVNLHPLSVNNFLQRRESRVAGGHARLSVAGRRGLGVSWTRPTHSRSCTHPRDTQRRYKAFRYISESFVSQRGRKKDSNRCEKSGFQSKKERDFLLRLKLPPDRIRHLPIGVEEPRRAGASVQRRAFE